MTARPDPLTAIRPQPFPGNQNITLLIPCATDKWHRDTERAKAGDAEFTDRLAKIGQSNPDRDAGLCAMQRQQARDGYVLVQISWNIYGFCVLDTLNDGFGVLWSGRTRDGTAEGALRFAAEWHARDPERREVLLSGYFPENFNGRNFRAEIDAALSAAGGKQ